MPRNEDRTRKDFEILGLETSASEDDKKKAFIKLALKLHPDRFNKSPDDITKMKFHEVCKAYKRLTTDQPNTADWNVDKSDETFFSLLADSLQHSSKTALCGLFSELPNHKSHFQNDNEYRIKEDVIDDEEDDETEVNRLVTILMNRLQNGKSLPAGLTQDRIYRLKEDFMKHREATRKCDEDEKLSSVNKKAKPPAQVPVTKPKPKSKKQILAEQRRREREMAKIAAELDEKKKKEEERETARKQLESEKQRKLEEEQRKLEEEKKRLALETKKRKDREEKEREQRQQKENERLEKLRKQQEEELKRKEEEKKRKAEEKAAKAKAAKELKEKDEKEKQDQSKKQQGNKRNQTQFQQAYQTQYPQYQQQQQQKYPREVPPRFLRQMQQRNLSGSNPQTDNDDNQEHGKSLNVRKDEKAGEADWDAEKSDNSSSVEQTNVNSVAWTETSSITNENWGQELSNSAGSLSDWGNMTGTEDWDATSDMNQSNLNDRSRSISNIPSNDIDKDALKNTELSNIGTIGSEMKSGKIPKKETLSSTDPVEHCLTSSNGQFGVIGQPIVTSNTTESEINKSCVIENCNVNVDTKLQIGDSKHKLPVVNKDPKELMYKDVIEQNIPTSSYENEQFRNLDKTYRIVNEPGTEKNSKNGMFSGNPNTPSPKLTGWSGLDPFEVVPSTTDVAKATSDKLNKTNNRNSSHELKMEKDNKMNIKDSVRNVIADKIIPDKSTAEMSSCPPIDVNHEIDEYGWTTASSKKTKQKSVVQSNGSREANAWMSRPLKQLLDMGFKREEAARALKENNGRIENAVSDLLSRTDVSGSGDIVQKSNSISTTKCQEQECDGTLITESSNDEILDSPFKRNRKQKQTQVHDELTENIISNKHVKDQHDLEKNAQVLTNQRPKSLEKSLEGDVKDNSIAREQGSMPVTINSNIGTNKTVGVIGSPLPGSTSTKSSPPLSQAGLAISNVMSQGTMNTLEMSKPPQTQIPTFTGQNNQSVSQTVPLLHPFSVSGVPSNVTHQKQQTLVSTYSRDSQVLPSQTANLQYMMHQKQQLAQIVASSSQTHTSSQIQIGHMRQHHFPQQQPFSADSQLPSSVSNVHSALQGQAFIPTATDLSANLTSAPQISKLHQWTQPLSKEETQIENSGEQDTSLWNSKAVSESSLPPSTIGAPVKVDPVSAKWGVIAAPRLSPTPCEFKPGVPWKPKADIEKGDRKQEDEVENNTGNTEEEFHMGATANLSDLRKETDSASSISTMRPPPGLDNVEMFKSIPGSRANFNIDLIDARPVEHLNSSKGIKQWLSLVGLDKTVNHHVLRQLCHDYGVVLSYKVGVNSAFICFENEIQAQDACRALNRMNDASNSIKAELLAEGDIPDTQDLPAHSSHGMHTKPLVPNVYPGVPPQNLWETSACLPGANSNILTTAPPPGTGLPATNIIGLDPRLGAWGNGRSETIVNPSPFWSMNVQAQGLSNQMPGFGLWPGTNFACLGAVNANTYATVSPSSNSKLLPDGLFNGSESM